MTFNDDVLRKQGIPLITRRTVLRGASAMVAAAALPAMPEAVPLVLAGTKPVPLPQATIPPTRADAPISEIMTRLSTYISQARDQVLPDEVIEKAKWHILDTCAAMVSGSELPAGRVGINFARAYGGKPVSTVVGDTTLCGPIEAALVNGVMAHADETDDTANGPWHPGCNVLPAALAVGEQFTISGSHLLRATVLGYDIGTRALNAVQPRAATSHRLNEGIAGIFGATAAACCAASLTPEQVRFALSYSAQQASGIETFSRDPDHIEKGFIFGGMGARSGVTSVLVVRAGWTAVNDIMSGTDNYLLEFAPTQTPNAELLVAKLGQDYGILTANIKRWTVGQPIQSILDCLEVLLKRQPIDPNQIREIVLRSAPGSITDNSGPGDINMQHAAAVMLVDKTVTFRSIHDRERMHDPAIGRLRGITRLEPGTPGGRGGPGGPVIQITLVDGTRITQDGVGPSLGGVANPMKREQLIAKCRDLMNPVLGETNCSRLIERVLGLEKTKNILELRPLLQPQHRGNTQGLSDYPKQENDSVR